MKPIFVVVDTHIYLKSHKEVIDKIIKKCHRLVLNGKILKQYERIAKKIGMDATVLYRKMMTDLSPLGKTYQQPRKIDVQKIIGFRLKKNDQPFLEAALSSQSKYIITNDADFHNQYKKLKQRGIEVINLSLY